MRVSISKGMAKSRLSGEEREVIAAPRPDLCLDFANTLSWRGSEPSAESLNHIDDLIGWCVNSGAAGARQAEAVRTWATKNPLRADALLAEAIELRELIFRIFRPLGAGGSPASADLARLNDWLKEAPARVVIDHASAGLGWRIGRAAEPAAAAILAPVLWSAGDLLAGPNRDRARHCANERCLWLFVDDSKTGNRRWCSMSACGNRAKARRHYVRHRDQQ